MADFKNKIKELKENKILGIILKVIKVCFAIMMVTFILMVLLQRVSDNRVSLFNLRIFTVVSGSMEPKYKIGDVLISMETKPEDIKVGDTISYIGERGTVAGKIITHQVESIDKDLNNKYVFHTKGLANDISDIYPVTEDQVYGVVVYKVFLLSLVYKVIGTTWGLFVFVVIPLLYIVGSEMIEIMLEKEEERRAKLKH